MYVTTTKHTRTNTQVEFYNFKNTELVDPSTADYFKSTYLGPGKIVSSQWEMAPDELSTTSTVVWESKAAYDQFKADEILTAGYFNGRDAHNASSGITIELVSAEEV